MKKPFLRWFHLWLLTGLLSTQAQQPPEHVNAYVFGVRAEQAEAAGKMEDALNFYGESLRMYQETAKQYPDWSPSVVQYRITATANQIERLKGVLDAEEKRRQAEADNAIRQRLDKAVAEARIVWLEEKQALDLRVTELQTERTAQEDALRSVETELGNTRALIAELEKTIATREKRIKKLEEGRDEAKSQTESLRAELEDKNAQILSLQQQLEQLPPPLITPEDLASLRGEVSAREAELNDARQTLAAHQQSSAEVAARLEEAEAKLAAALAGRAEEVQQHQTALAALEQELADRVSEISVLQEQLSSPIPPLITPEDLASLRGELSAREAELNEARQTLAAHQQSSAEVAARLEEAETKLAAALAGREEDMLQHQAAVAALEQEQADRMEKMKQDHEKAVSRLEKKITKLDAASAEAREKVEALDLALLEQLAERAQMETHMEEWKATTITQDDLNSAIAERDAKVVELEALQARMDTLQQEAAKQGERLAAMEVELAEANTALETARSNVSSVSGSETMAASYEKSQVENIVFRANIQEMKTRLDSLSGENTRLTESLALERNGWAEEKNQLNERINALAETIDLNQQELGKVKEMRATIRSLEKENRKLSKQVQTEGADAPQE